MKRKKRFEHAVRLQMNGDGTPSGWNVFFTLLDCVVLLLLFANIMGFRISEMEAWWAEAIVYLLIFGWLIRIGYRFWRMAPRPRWERGRDNLLAATLALIAMSIYFWVEGETAEHRTMVCGMLIAAGVILLLALYCWYRLRRVRREARFEIEQMCAREKRRKARGTTLK